MVQKTCCFTRHRKLPQNNMKKILQILDQKLEELYQQGVTDCISGGALGFDQIAASLVISKRQMGYNMRLILALPCRDQDKLWPDNQKQLYQNLLSEADELIYVSDRYTDGCMKKRNCYMKCTPNVRQYDILKLT